MSKSMSVSVTALLMAGGLSRRMGRDKATLIVAGEPLWARQLRLLRELESEAIWISARARPEWRPEEVEVILDEPPSRGPLSGVAAALARLQTSHLLALAIDLPRITSAHLRKLQARAVVGCGVVPFNGDRFEPLCAIYPKEAAAVASERLQRNDVSLQGLVSTLAAKKLVRAYSVEAIEKELYLNVNTLQDLEGV